MTDDASLLHGDGVAFRADKPSIANHAGANPDTWLVKTKNTAGTRGVPRAPHSRKWEKAGARAAASGPARRSSFCPVFSSWHGGCAFPVGGFPLFWLHPRKTGYFGEVFGHWRASHRAPFRFRRSPSGSAFRETPAVFALFRFCPGGFVFFLGGVARSRATPPSLLRTLKVFS